MNAPKPPYVLYCIRVDFVEMPPRPDLPIMHHWLREAGELAVVDNPNKAIELASSEDYVRNCVLDEFHNTPMMVGPITSVRVFAMIEVDAIAPMKTRSLDQGRQIEG